MKMQRDDYIVFRDMVHGYLRDNPGHFRAYKEAGLSDKRARWDITYKSKITRQYIRNVLYDYLDDTHIDTALRKIAKEV